MVSAAEKMSFALQNLLVLSLLLFVSVVVVIANVRPIVNI